MLIQFPDTTLTLPIQFFGSVDYYATMAAAGRAVIDDTARFDKRFKSAHRCDIADTRGLLRLTVPIRKPDDRQEGRRLTWADIRISDHGQWWHDAATSIASAYGRTPFYEFYIDRLARFFSRTTPEEFASVAELDKAVDAAVRKILGINTAIGYASEGAAPEGQGGQVEVTPLPYYQVRAQKLGFMPHLSILDLIFNMGPEAPLILHSMAAKK